MGEGEGDEVCRVVVTPVEPEGAVDNAASAAAGAEGSTVVTVGTVTGACNQQCVVFRTYSIKDYRDMLYKKGHCVGGCS